MSVVAYVTSVLINNPVYNLMLRHLRLSKVAIIQDDIAAKIEADTKVKIEAMNRSVATNKVY